MQARMWTSLLLCTPASASLSVSLPSLSSSLPLRSVLLSTAPCRRALRELRRPLRFHADAARSALARRHSSARLCSASPSASAPRRISSVASSSLTEASSMSRSKSRLRDASQAADSASRAAADSADSSAVALCAVSGSERATSCSAICRASDGAELLDGAPAAVVAGELKRVRAACRSSGDRPPRLRPDVDADAGADMKAGVLLPSASPRVVPLPAANDTLSLRLLPGARAVLPPATAAADDSPCAGVAADAAGAGEGRVSSITNRRSLTAVSAVRSSGSASCSRPSSASARASARAQRRVVGCACPRCAAKPVCARRSSVHASPITSRCSSVSASAATSDSTGSGSGGSDAPPAATRAAI